MSAETGLYGLLAGAAGVTALVGDRIYPDLLPEDAAYPSVVFGRTGTEIYTGIGGQIYGEDAEIQIACWAETRTAADGVAAAVMAALVADKQPANGRTAAVDPESGHFAALVTTVRWVPA